VVSPLEGQQMKYTATESFGVHGQPVCQKGDVVPAVVVGMLPKDCYLLAPVKSQTRPAAKHAAKA